jgi:SAM-dependent methyltransferase
MTQRQDSSLQRDHYDRILGEYDDAYGDPMSLEYRQRFFLSPLWRGMDLNGTDVADIAAGSGHSTIAVKERFPTARVIGFDVSERAVQAYMRRTGCEARVWDVTGNDPPSRSFDVGIVVGGLHHCVRSIDRALDNIAHVIRPGGVLLMVEPNRDTFLEPVRRHWYRQDSYFESSTEGALSYQELAALGQRWFEPVWVRYMGGLAYFVVYNSLVLRVPPTLKRSVARPLMAFEQVTNTLPVKRLFPYFVARWSRR